MQIPERFKLPEPNDIKPRSMYSIKLQRSLYELKQSGSIYNSAPTQQYWNDIKHILCYIRETINMTSMARKIYLGQGFGFGAFRRIYGGAKRNGSRPPHFCESSGAIARHILQELQKMKILDIDPKGGRRITSSGQRDLDQVARRILVAS
ncbi:hypothetical protein PVL29_019358 [Vitis rotundifolia]|uniref:40S ribosomal protein S19 n=1 Tax=Vitis rotundifolia TaxID=103349 RepID=A0AA38Z7N6_VITRO|nr:hypothetical protein PVL29_019358 [Vitis rotundifolia]